MDKIPSLKDFIIYVIPGILTCYFGLNILDKIFATKTSINIDSISQSSVLSFIGIIFSFAVGFIVSQSQLIVYNFFFNRLFKNLRTIQGASLSLGVKDSLTKQIKDKFKIVGVTDSEIQNDELILYNCLNYVKIFSNEESHLFVNRASNLASFASVIQIPVFLGVWSFLLSIAIPTCWVIWILTGSTILTICLTTKIIYNFRREWSNSIYRQFLILSLKP